MSALVYFDRGGRWGETLVCEQRVRLGLQALGIEHGTGTRPAPGKRVLRVRGKAGVFYFEGADGWVGLLCEAGEWVAAPPALPAFAPGKGPATVLPSRNEFIETLLVQLGEEAE